MSANTYAIPSDGQRVFVGNPEVQSNAVLLQQIAGGTARDICAFSQLSWRQP